MENVYLRLHLGKVTSRRTAKNKRVEAAVANTPTRWTGLQRWICVMSRTAPVSAEVVSKAYACKAAET